MTGQPQFCRRIFKCSKDPSIGDLNFYVPAELLVPCDTDDICVVDFFKNNLLEICASRNNNVELQDVYKRQPPADNLHILLQTWQIPPGT